MIVQCPSCSTRYNLPEDKIPPQGAKVKCSRCEHVFVAKLPTPEETVEDLLGQESETSEKEAPKPEPKPEPESEEPAVSEEPAAPEESPVDESPVDEPSIDESSVDESPVDESAGGDDMDFSDLFDDDDDGDDESDPFDDIAASMDSESAAEEAPAEEAASSTDDIDDLFDDDLPEPPAEKAAKNIDDDLDDLFGDDSGDSDKDFDSLFDELENEQESGEPEKKEIPDSGPADDLFGDDDDEDIPDLSDDDIPDEIPASAPAGDSAEDMDLSIGDEKSRSAEDAAGEMTFGATLDDNLDPEKKPAGNKKLAIILAVVLILVLGGVGGWYFLMGPGAPAPVQQPEAPKAQLSPEERVKDIALQNVRQFYVNNDKTGSLFVVEGKAVNNFQTPKEDIEVEATLYDANRKVLATKRILCGNTLSLFQLQVQSQEEVESALKSEVGILSNNTYLRTGMDTPFMIVFFNPPENVKHFGVKIVNALDPETE